MVAELEVDEDDAELGLAFDSEPVLEGDPDELGPDELDSDEAAPDSDAGLAVPSEPDSDLPLEPASAPLPARLSLR